MGIIQIIIGLIVTGIGLYSWYNLLSANTPDPSIPQISTNPTVITPDIMLSLAMAPIMTGVGIWILVKGIKSTGIKSCNLD